MVDKEDLFSAGASALGYIYQVRYALLESLRRLRNGETDFGVSFETLDDVVFEKGGAPPDLLQTKHHVDRAANLTDASPDLWKSIRVWAEFVTDGKVPAGTARFLVTTAKIGISSAASYLVPGTDRDETKALERLRATSQSSTSTTNAAAYSAFKALTAEQQMDLMASIRIVDLAPPMSQSSLELERELFQTAERRLVPALAVRLDAWWLGRAVRHLTSGSDQAILSQEIEAEIGALREQFIQDNLPIDQDIVDSQVDLAEYTGRTFIHQLEVIGLRSKRILFAVHDYYRAFEQRSRWMREELLYIGELDRYERQLTEEWERHFERMNEDLGDEATDKAKTAAARELYAWVESKANMPIRPSCNATFITRGSFHMLSDKQRVGWHPDFVQRIAQILEKLGAA